MKISAITLGGCFLAVACLAAGCQSDSGWKFPSNPFAKKEEPAKSREFGPVSEVAGTEAAPSTAADKASLSPCDPKDETRLLQELAKARNAERAGKYEEARGIYEKLIADFPDQPEPYHRLAVVADYQRRYREAQALYAQAIRLDPDNPDLFNDLGYCFYLEGRLTKAESALAKAVTIRPGDPRYRNNLGMVYGHMGDFDRALNEFRYAGSEADAQYNLAFVLAAKNNLEGAKECFRRALAVDPNHEPAKNALASFIRTEQDPNHLGDAGELAANGVRWVPFVENPSGTETGGMQTASANMPVNSANTLNRPTSQQLRERAQAMMAERIQTNRTTVP